MGGWEGQGGLTEKILNIFKSSFVLSFCLFIVGRFSFSMLYISCLHLYWCLAPQNICSVNPSLTALNHPIISQNGKMFRCVHQPHTINRLGLFSATLSTAVRKFPSFLNFSFKTNYEIKSLSICP